MSNLPCILTYQNLIYGNEHLSDNENAYVFIKVQEFIIASRRFAAELLDRFCYVPGQTGMVDVQRKKKTKKKQQ